MSQPVTKPTGQQSHDVANTKLAVQSNAASAQKVNQLGVSSGGTTLAQMAAKPVIQRDTVTVQGSTVTYSVDKPPRQQTSTPVATEHTSRSLLEQVTPQPIGITTPKVVQVTPQPTTEQLTLQVIPTSSTTKT